MRLQPVLVTLLLGTISLLLLGQVCNAMDDKLWNQLLAQGMNAFRQNNWQQAGQALTQSLKAAEEFGTSDHRVAASLVNLACVYAHYKDYTRAISMSKRALTIDQRIYGNHPDVAHDLHQLGTYLDLAGQHVEATPILEKALSMRESLKGVKPVLIAVSLDNLGENMVSRGSLPEAAAYFRRAARIYKMQHAPQEYFMRLERLRDLYAGQNEFEQIDELYKAELASLERRFGSDSQWVSSLLSQQTHFYMGLKIYLRAEAGLRRMLAISSNSPAGKSLQVAAAANGLAVCLYKQAKYSDASPYFKQAIALLEHSGNPEQVLDIKENYADCLDKLGHKQEASDIRKDHRTRK